MDTKKRKIDLKNPKVEKDEPRDVAFNDDNFDVFRNCADLLSKDDLLDFITEQCLCNSSVFLNFKIKFGRKQSLKKVFVRSIPSDTTEKSFNAAMAEFGEIEETTLLQDKGYGFAVYKDFSDTMKALGAKKALISNRPVYIHSARKKDGKKDGERRALTSAKPGVGRKIYVGNLPDTADEEALRRCFEKYGAIEAAYVPKDKRTDRRKGFGFIVFATVDDAVRAVHEREKEINGAIVTCNFADIKKKDADATNNSFESSPDGNEAYEGCEAQVPFYCYPQPQYAAVNALPNAVPLSAEAYNNLKTQLHQLNMAQAQLAKMIEDRIKPNYGYYEQPRLHYDGRERESDLATLEQRDE